MVNNNYRRADKAGSWYPSSESDLRSLIDSFHTSAMTNIDNSVILSSQSIAAITPHAGLAFSGECATRAYYALSQKHPNPKTIIVLGAVHNYSTCNAGVWSRGAWETPLGDICVDEDLADTLIHSSFAEEDFTSHFTDNSIELQAPLIKYFFPESMILPISTPPSDQAADLGKIIFKLTTSSPEEYLVIGSSDLTHYGSAYGFSPAGDGLDGIEWARENDMRLIRLIETLAVESIIPEANKSRSACGSGAIAATTSYASSCNILSGHTLEHILSYDIMPSNPPEMSVGYASILF